MAARNTERRRAPVKKSTKKFPPVGTFMARLTGAIRARVGRAWGLRR